MRVETWGDFATRFLDQKRGNQRSCAIENYTSRIVAQSDTRDSDTHWKVFNYSGRIGAAKCGQQNRKHDLARQIEIKGLV
jgi:hypothetical protein